MPNNEIISDASRTLVEQETYDTVREYIVAAQKKITVAINSAMVEAYWNIGKRIYEACGESERAEYGKQLLQFLADKLTAEFGKGFSVRNLQMMRQFYLIFPNANALRSELSWTHYRSLLTRFSSCCTIKSAGVRISKVLFVCVNEKFGGSNPLYSHLYPGWI